MVETETERVSICGQTLFDVLGILEELVYGHRRLVANKEMQDGKQGFLQICPRIMDLCMAKNIEIDV